MKKMIQCAVLMAAMLCAPSAKAQTVSNMQEQWTDSARLALAQCLVSESGWERITEYSAISHLLVRRWERRRGSVSLEGFIKQYCAVHRVPHPSPRQQWVLRLPMGTLTENPGFPSTVTWTNYVRPWNDAQLFVTKFMQGEYADPTPQAQHWGGAMDGTPIGGHLIPADVQSVDPATRGRMVHLVNLFYAMDMGERRRYLTLSRRPAQAAPVGQTVVPARLARGRGNKR